MAIKMDRFPHPISFNSLVRITEAAASACVPYIGSKDSEASDQVAVHAMRRAFKQLAIKGTIVIGEGERDQAPMLYIGETVGRWGDKDFEWDIAVDPLEGTNLCANGKRGALSVCAFAPKGGLFLAPDIYMEKLVGSNKLKGHISLNKSPVENIYSAAKALNKEVRDISVVVLNRPRHQKLIQSITDTKAQVHLIEDGDIAAAIQTCRVDSGVDLLMGIGGSPEGVLAAAALQCLGGVLQARLVFQNTEQKKRAAQMNIQDLSRIYTLQDLARSPLIFCATGVTDGELVQGVKKSSNQITTESLYMDSQTKACLKVHSHIKHLNGDIYAE